jgi:cytochrome c biogenesis factor
MVIVTAAIQLFQILKQKLGEKEAEALVSFVDSRIREGNEASTRTLSTKEDMAHLRTELKTEIASTKAEIIKWMFIFWIGQIVVTFGFILLFLNK